MTRRELPAGTPVEILGVTVTLRASVEAEAEPLAWAQLDERMAYERLAELEEENAALRAELAKRLLGGGPMPFIVPESAVTTNDDGEMRMDLSRMRGDS